MESLNMDNLASSLPSSTIVKAEQDTMDKFKAAAQSLTLLYRSSQKASKRHFDAGYATALDDLLSVIQHGVSAGPDPNLPTNDAEGGMTIGRVLDWIEARQEGLRTKAREDEEDEDERDAKSKAGSSKPATETSKTTDARDKVKVRPSENTVSSSTTVPSHRSPGRMSTRLPQQTLSAPTSALPLSSLSSTSLPMAASSLPPQPQSSSRPQTRARLRSSHHVLAPHNANATSHSTVSGSPSSPSTSLPPAPSVASVLGAKRRHAAILLDSFAPSSTSLSVTSPDFELSGAPMPNGNIMSNASPRETFSFAGSNGSATSSGTNTNLGQRRRIRNSRIGTGVPRLESQGYADGLGLSGGEFMMDVEEDGGRDRKRVARR